MGACCCCKKSKELKELEDELDMLVNQKKLLEMKIIKQENKVETESTSSHLSSDNLKFIEYDLYSSLKTIEILSSLTLTELDTHHLSQKIQKVGTFSSTEKILKYSEARCEETDLQKKLVISLQESHKALTEIIHKKMTRVEERIEKVESLLLNSKHFIEERQGLISKFREISLSKTDFSSLILSLSKLESLDISLSSLEHNIPLISSDPLFTLKLKNIEQAFIALGKSSLSTLSGFETILGQASNTSVDVVSLKSSELNQDTFQVLFESISKQLSALQDLESAKYSISVSQVISEKIIAIDEMLNNHFMSASKDKEQACTRLKRLSKSSSDFSYLIDSGFYSFEKTQSIKENLDVLENKAKNYLKIGENQNKLLLEMTEKFGKFDEILDEIEIKFQEFVSAETKDLYKIIAGADAAIKETLDKVTEKLIHYSEETHKDLVNRLEYFLAKIQLTENLQKVKNSVRESQNKDLSKVRSEMQEKINDLINKVNLLISEKEMISNTLNTGKIQLSLTEKRNEELLKSLNEKEQALASLKSSLASLEENMQHTSEENNRLQEEVEDLQKETRECKKNLRNKEHEISELIEELAKNKD